MFENVLGQGASLQLIEDIKAGYLARSMLFYGPPASGKGSAALELSRVISCGENAAWACQCPACSRHRYLLHPDLLCLGPRSFSAEITASAKAFLRETLNQEKDSVSAGTKTGAARILFIRSARKLLARFNPLLWEDEPKAGKIFPLVNSLEDSLDELISAAAETAIASKAGASENQNALSKLVDSIIKDSYKLESEGIAEIIPIGQLRRAAAWSHLAPSGKGKFLIIENADRMQDEARNSLLKILEEPPESLHCVLTTSRQGNLLPTIVSRLRPYRFYQRDAAVEKDVIRRVFRTEAAEAEFTSINGYLDSFLPVPGNVLEGLAAFFAASVAYKEVLLCKKQGKSLPQAAVLLGKYSAPKAEAAGLGRPLGDAGELVPKIIEKAGSFEIRSLFSRFLANVLEQVSGSLKCVEINSSAARIDSSSILPSPDYNERWKKCINWAGLAALTYKLRPAQVLEKLFTDLSREMTDL